MKKVFTTKAFLLFTIIFISIAVMSFVAFRETESACTSAQKCNPAPSHESSEMLWDVFSHRLVSLISI